MLLSLAASDLQKCHVEPRIDFRFPFASGWVWRATVMRCLRACSPASQHSRTQSNRVFAEEAKK
eukprot:3428185-Rhodomonas_salina.1